jgi:hypothetical protein
MRKNKKGIALAVGLALLLGAIGLALEFQGGFSVAKDNHQLADVSGIIASESSSVSIPTALSASTSPAMPFSAGVTGATSTATSSTSQTPRNIPSFGAGTASAKVTDAKKLTAKTPVTKISRVPAATAVLPMPLLIITPGPIFEPDGTAAAEQL